VISYKGESTTATIVDEVSLFLDNIDVVLTSLPSMFSVQDVDLVDSI
jgi:hypothetical protein